MVDEFLEAFLKDVEGEHLEKPTLLKEGCRDPGRGGHVEQIRRSFLAISLSRKVKEI